MEISLFSLSTVLSSLSISGIKTYQLLFFEQEKRRERERVVSQTVETRRVLPKTAFLYLPPQTTNLEEEEEGTHYHHHHSPTVAGQQQQQHKRNRVFTSSSSLTIISFWVFRHGTFPSSSSSSSSLSLQMRFTTTTTTTNKRTISKMSSVVMFIVFFLSFISFQPTNAIRSFRIKDQTEIELPKFTEAPEYRNGAECSLSTMKASSCDPSHVHIAMTLDSEYLRGSMAAVLSILTHASCPENVFFHFIVAESDSAKPMPLNRLVRSTFPSLNFKIYLFQDDLVKNLISSSIRLALENPLNYARNYLADILDPCVNRVIYLDSDLLVVDDIQKLWNISLTGSRIIGAPEYCHANFTQYFTDGFWFDPLLSKVFDGRNPCYFNTGVMIMDLVRWREGNYRSKIEVWMEIQKQKRIYELGSLPPFLLIFGGDVEAIDHKWNQHGLGGDNKVGSCRSLHPGPVSLLHWSGKGKPWARLDAMTPCPLDHLWAPYDLYLPHKHHKQQLERIPISSHSSSL